MTLRPQIVYGLANRVKAYGVKKSCSAHYAGLIKSLVDLGITSFDGAENYGWNVEDLGFLREQSGMTISTKIVVRNRCTKDMLDLVERRKKSIGEGNTLLVYAHNEIEDCNRKSFVELIKGAREMRDVRIGLSVYSSNELKKTLGLDGSKLRIDAIQLPVNPTNTTCDVIPKDCDKDIFARSIFLQGLIFVEKSMVPQNVSARLERLDRVLKTVEARYELERGEVMIGYALAKAREHGIRNIVIGSTDIDRIRRYKVLVETMSDELMSKVKESLSNSYDEILADPRSWKT